MKDLVKIGQIAAKQAGQYLINNFGKIDRIEIKGDRNLATDIDKKAEQIIVDRIKTEFPTHGIFAEESGKEKINTEYTWIIDPLDGTHNYIHNIEIFGVSLGVIHKGDFIVGIVYLPCQKELYIGEKGNGAYKNGEKISVSTTEKLKECSISFDSSIRYSPDLMLKALNKLSKNVFNIRMFGSSARFLTYLAEGKIDLAVEFNDQPWDYAGSVSIIQEAGGKITTLKGKKLSYETVGYIASNGLVHDKVEEIILSCLK